LLPACEYSRIFRKPANIVTMFWTDNKAVVSIHDTSSRASIEDFAG